MKKWERRDDDENYRMRLKEIRRLLNNWKNDELKPRGDDVSSHYISQIDDFLKLCQGHWPQMNDPRYKSDPDFYAEVMEIVEKRKCSFAFPSQSLYIEKN